MLAAHLLPCEAYLHVLDKVEPAISSKLLQSNMSSKYPRKIKSCGVQKMETVPTLPKE